MANKTAEKQLEKYGVICGVSHKGEKYNLSTQLIKFYNTADFAEWLEGEQDDFRVRELIDPKDYNDLVDWLNDLYSNAGF